MSFTDAEFSLDQGKPLRLYLFEHGPVYWGYTNADREIHFQNRDYAPIAISDDGLRQTGETSADALTLTVPDDIGPVKLFIGHPPSGEVWLTIRDFHFGQADAPASAMAVWVGSIQSVKWTQPGAAEIICNSLASSFGRNALRLAYERNCPHAIYDRLCRLSRSLYRFDTSIASLDGASIEVAGIDPAHNYAGGHVEWVLPGGVLERRGIEAQSGNALTILSGTAGLKVGLPVAIFPGCDQTRATCNGAYANLDNYGGYPHMPGSSPFENNQFF